MPESFENQAQRDPEREQRFQQRLEEIRANMRIIYDRAQREGKSPSSYILEDFTEERLADGSYIFGEDRMSDVLNSVKAVTAESEEAFTDQMVEILQPLLETRFFDQETYDRAEEVESRERVETMRAEKLDVFTRQSPWDLELSDGTKINKGDSVLEINWPDAGETPRGLSDVRNSFSAIAAILEKDPSLKAVIGVSWMMARSATTKLGFEKFPEAEIDDEQIHSILSLATRARSDKPYQRGVEAQDVQVGAISRDEFLSRYKAK